MWECPHTSLLFSSHSIVSLLTAHPHLRMQLPPIHQWSTKVSLHSISLPCTWDLSGQMPTRHLQLNVSNSKCLLLPSQFSPLMGPSSSSPALWMTTRVRKFCNPRILSFTTHMQYITMPMDFTLKNLWNLSTMVYMHHYHGPGMFSPISLLPLL